jgi:hypothetical protein
MSSIPSYNDAVFAYEKLCSKLSILNKKIESIQHRIVLEENAFEQRRKPLAEDTGYNYYVRTRDNTIENIKIMSQEIEAKINTLEAKRDCAIRAINEEYDRKIDVLQRKKDTEKASLQTKVDQHQKEVENVVQKYEASRPNSVVYTKMVSDKEQTQKEIDDLNAEVQQALVVLMAAQRKDMEKRQREEMNRLRQVEREQFLKDEEDRARLRQQRDNERKAEEERARQRCEAAKALNAALEEIETETKVVESKPTKKSRKKLSFPLDPKKKYTVDELDTIDIDWEKDGDENCEMWEKLRREAAEREGISGAEAWRKQPLSPE